MTTYCKYCYELDHDAPECKQAPSNRTVCYYRYQQEHIYAQWSDKVLSANSLWNSTKKLGISSEGHYLNISIEIIKFSANQNMRISNENISILITRKNRILLFLLLLIRRVMWHCPQYEFSQYILTYKLNIIKSPYWVDGSIK